MRILADTHSVLWWALDDPRLSKAARASLSSLQTTVLVSAASAWEIATKVRIGKLPEADEFSRDFARNLARLGFHELPISVEHGRRAGSLSGSHKDPFDRMLIAQSLALGIPVVSRDEVFDAYGVERIW